MLKYGGLFFLATVLAAYLLWPEQKDFAGENKAVGAVPEEQAFRTVRAETRTMTSVLVLDANVVANPQFRVTAPADGILVDMGKNRFGVRPAAKNSADSERLVLARDGITKDDRAALGKELPKGLIEQISLPQNSVIEHLLVLPGAKVTAGLPVFNARYTGFALQAIVPPEKLHRLFEGIISARAEITNGPGLFDSPILGTPFVPGAGGYILDPDYEEGNEDNDEDYEEDNNEDNYNGDNNAGYLLFGGAIQVTDFTQGVVVIAAAPANLRLLEGAPGLLALTTAKVTNAVVLPIEAVAGISRRGQVYLYQDGQRLLRDVTLGITDGSYVEITSGLRAGDQVIVPSPGIANLR
ncbi:MAG: hypothetical protein KGZ32_00235 [Dethiobacter sp.]|nr:hypothetical protein [Dethiobacter sp.]